MIKDKPQSTTKPKQTTTKAKVKNTTNKAKKDNIKGDPDIEVIKGNASDVLLKDGKGIKPEQAQPEEVNLFDKMEIQPQAETRPKKYSRGGAAIANPINATPSELSIKMAKLKVIYDWDKIDLDSDDAVEERISDYFNYSIAEGLKPNIEGLAMALGIDRRTLWTWETGQTHAKMDSTRMDMIKKAKDYIAFLMSDMVMDNKINPITWIFYAKNYFGMKDTQDIQFTATNVLQPTMSLEEIADKVAKDVVIDVDYTE